MTFSISYHQKQQALSLASLLIQAEGAATFLLSLKEAFPKEYQALTGATVNDQLKKGYLLDAHLVRRNGPGMADPAAPKRRPSGDRGSKLRSGHPQSESTGANSSFAFNSKEVPVSDDLPR